MVAVGFEPTPSRTSALNWRLGPLGQTTSRLPAKSFPVNLTLMSSAPSSITPKYSHPPSFHTSQVVSHNRDKVPYSASALLSTTIGYPISLCGGGSAPLPTGAAPFHKDTQFIQLAPFSFAIFCHLSIFSLSKIRPNASRAGASHDFHHAVSSVSPLRAFSPLPCTGICCWSPQSRDHRDPKHASSYQAPLSRPVTSIQIVRLIKGIPRVGGLRAHLSPSGGVQSGVEGGCRQSPCESAHWKPHAHVHHL